MLTSLKNSQSEKPKPAPTKCEFCDKPVEPVWTRGEWETKRIHDECQSTIKRYRETGLDEIFWRLPPFQIEEKNKKAYEAAQEFIKERKQSLLFTGSAGTGKTHLAVEIAQNIPGSIFIKVPKLMITLKSNFEGQSWANEKIIEKLSNAPVLILDDLGAEKASDWVAEVLYVIIDDRYGNFRPTIMTSNFDAEELADRLGDRIMSRIMGMCRLIRLSSSDKRKGLKYNELKRSY